MSELAQYRPPTDVSTTGAAHVLIDWAQSADAAYSLANRLCSTSFVPAQFKGKPVEAAAAMLAGAEVGLSPMASLRAFDVIQGVAAPRALTMRAVAQSQGHEFITDEATPTKVKMRGRRRGSSEWQTVEWTIQRATQLGLTSKEQWKKQPQTMLIARATTELVRLVAADAILGIGYSIEELQDEASTVTVSREPAASRKVGRAPKPEPVEPEFDEPVEVTVEPEPTTEPLRTLAQSKRLWAMLTENGMTEREHVIAWLTELLGRDVDSTTTLTKAECARAMDALEPTPAELDTTTQGALDEGGAE